MGIGDSPFKGDTWASVNDWLHVMDGANNNMSISIPSFEALWKHFSLNYKPVSSTGPLGSGQALGKNRSPFLFLGGGTFGGGDSGALTSTAQNILQPVHYVAQMVGGALTLGVATGTVEVAAGGTAMAGATFLGPVALILGVAAACGFSMSTRDGNEFLEYLKNIHFDWGPDAILNEDGSVSKILALVRADKGSPTWKSIFYIEHDLTERIISALNDWGLWDERPTVEPYEPTIGEYVQYNFHNRFPNIPFKYVSKFQEIVNHFNIDIDGRYITCAISTDEHLRLIVFQSGYLNFRYRSTKFNDYSIVDEDELCCMVQRGNLEEHVVAYDMTDTGEMSIAWEQDIGALPLSITGGTRGVIFDNFGTNYRTIETGNYIGSTTEAYNSLVEDPDAVDLRSGIEVMAPLLWGLRILASIPDINQWPRTIPAAEPLNEQKPYIPIQIQDGIPDVNFKQLKAWTDPTDDEEAEPIVNDDEGYSKIGYPPKGPVINPPIPTPTVPDIHLSPWGVSDSGMISLYNPTSVELKNFSQWLWSIDPTDLDNIKKLLQNPFDALIGLHQIYATPVKLQDSKAHIILGRIDSEYPSDIIKQYTSISCGDPIQIKPYTNNAHDYISVSVQLYLPFIGIVDLATSEVMGRYIKVGYQVDFLTGTCLAIVSISRDGTNFYTAYTFPGNCAVQLPLTGGNYASFLGNIVGLGMSAVGAAIGGGAGAAVGAALGSTMKGASGAGLLGGVQRSGGLGANAGAMGQKKPYLIISRHPVAEATNRGALQGLPQNMRAKLGSCMGYTRITDINLAYMSCTEDEKVLIKQKLMGGVII